MTSTTVANLSTGQKPQSPTAQFSGFLDKLKPQLALALPKHMNADRMARLALSAFSSNPDLQKCTRESIAACVMTAAQQGLEPGVGGHGYLIPYFDRRKNAHICTWVPGWKGLVDLVSRSGRATVWTGAVFDGDQFDYQLGDAPFCKHKPSDDDTSGQDFRYVYAIGRVRNAEMPVIEVWSRAKVLKHLAQFNKVGDRHYAKASENNLQMYGRKVALLQVLKYMPSSIELSTAMEQASQSVGGEGLVIDSVTGMPVDDGAGGEPQGTAAGGGAVPDFDPDVAMAKIKACKDADTLALIADEISDLLPEGPTRTALLDAYRLRAAEIGA